MKIDQLDDVLSKLDKVNGHKKQFNAICPAHDDTDPSLRISLGKDDNVLLKCLRGCTLDEIVRSLNMSISDLWPKETDPAVPRERKKISVAKPEKKTLTNTYKYYDENGTLVMEVLRYVKANGRKTFMQRKPNPNGGWEWKTDDIEKPLYNLPAVLRAVANGETIWPVEGEKDADTMVSLGRVGTTNPGGAGGAGQRKWMPHHTETLRGANVAIICDNDQPGFKHAAAVRDYLLAADCKVKVYLPSTYPDVTQMIEAGQTLNDLKLINPDDYIIPGEDDGIEEEFGDESPDPIDMFLAEIEAIAAQPDTPIERKAELIRIKSETLILNSAGDELDRGRLVEWKEFFAEKVDDSYDWIIPDLLERGDRVMVVAAEGAGKTTLARQVAMLSSAGIHPFTREKMPPIRCLMVDLENPERIIRRTTGKIFQKIKSFGMDEAMDNNSFLWTKPDGLNLLKAQDRAIMEEMVAATEPDLILFGPIYKSFLDPGGQTSEAICGQLVRFFDYLRVKYDCALWMEHHAPLGSNGNRELRPFGSAVWSRWSEFGIAIQPDPTDPELIQFNHYRGQREVRQWPITCKRGTTWPFEVVEFADISDYAPTDNDNRTDEELNEQLAANIFDDKVTAW
jgi:hypothetical protein